MKPKASSSVSSSGETKVRCLALVGLIGCVEPEVGSADMPTPGFDKAPEVSCDAGERVTVATDVDDAGFAVMPMSAGFAVSYSRDGEIAVRTIGDVARRAGPPHAWKNPPASGDDVHVANVGLWLKRLAVVTRDGHAMHARLYDRRMHVTQELAGIDDRDVVRVDVAAHDGKIVTAALVRGAHAYDVIATEHVCLVR